MHCTHKQNEIHRCVHLVKHIYNEYTQYFNFAKSFASILLCKHFNFFLMFHIDISVIIFRKVI